MILLMHFKCNILNPLLWKYIFLSMSFQKLQEFFVYFNFSSRFGLFQSIFTSSYKYWIGMQAVITIWEARRPALYANKYAITSTYHQSWIYRRSMEVYKNITLDRFSVISLSCKTSRSRLSTFLMHIILYIKYVTSDLHSYVLLSNIVYNKTVLINTKFATFFASTTPYMVMFTYAATNDRAWTCRG